MTNIEFKKVFERDMDLLMIEEFVSDKAFARIFLDKVGLSDDYTIAEAVHSQADNDGESDITLILQYPDAKVGILIEDKIDAPTMQDQSSRYLLRGETGKKQGKYQSYHVFLAAPQEYHDERRNDANAQYENKVTYEELRAHFAKKDTARARYKVAVIDCALHEKKAGYQKVEDATVTAFWKNLREFCLQTHPELSLLGTDEPKGANSIWPAFTTSLRGVKVIFKSDRGAVDLEFPKYGDRTGDLERIIGNRKDADMKIRTTGKAASIRLENPNWEISFHEPFMEHRDAVCEVLNAVSRLCKLTSQLNYSEVYP